VAWSRIVPHNVDSEPKRLKHRALRNRRLDLDRNLWTGVHQSSKMLRKNHADHILETRIHIQKLVFKNSSQNYFSFYRKIPTAFRNSWRNQGELNRSTMTTLLHSDYHVLVLAPFGKDGALVREVLLRSGIPVNVVTDAAAIARCVGGGAGAAIVAEEALDEEAIECLGRSVAAQPAWSDFPIIVLTGGGATTPYTENDGSLAHTHGQY
jgi:hypothetical protein